MVRKASRSDIPSIIELLHQVNMVHHELRPDLFKPYTTKYDEEELEALLGDESKPVFVYEDGEGQTESLAETGGSAGTSRPNTGTGGYAPGTILGHAFCMVTEVRDHRLLQDIKTLYIDDICVDEKARGKHVGKALFDYVRDYAKSIGCNNITLNVWEGNDPASFFYRNMGMHVQKTTMEMLITENTV